MHRRDDGDDDEDIVDDVGDSGHDDDETMLPTAVGRGGPRRAVRRVRLASVFIVISIDRIPRCCRRTEGLLFGNGRCEDRDSARNRERLLAFVVFPYGESLRRPRCVQVSYRRRDQGGLSKM
jgi:hypothetical protein